MALTVKRISLWKTEVDNKPGALANVLGPLADAGTDLQVVMGYRFPGNETKAAIEVYPVLGTETADVARSTGLGDSGIPTLLVEGDNKQGLGKVIADAMSGAGINMGFMVTQVIGPRYSCVIGFDSEEDAEKAVGLLEKVAG